MPKTSPKPLDPGFAGRLALRQEGDYWNAYYALPDMMQGAILLGSIHMGLVVKDPAIKEAFMQLMTNVVGDLLHDITGERPEFHRRPAPAHERTRE